MANISDDVQVYIRALMAEHMVNLDSKDSGPITNQDLNRKDNAFLHERANQSIESNEIRVTGDE